MPEEWMHEMQQVVSRFSGVIGVAVRRLDGDRSGLDVEMNARDVFPTASVIKLPIMVEAFRQHDRGDLSLDERLELIDEEKVTGSGVIQHLSAGLRLTVIDLVTLMIVLSDNTATNLLIERVGRERVNRTMKDLGCTKTYLVGKLQLPPEKRNDEQRQGVINHSTPLDMVNLLTSIYLGEAASKKSCEQMLSILQKQNLTAILGRHLPLDAEEGELEARLGSKSGSIRGVRNDVGIVWGAASTYAVALFSKGCTDRLYRHENEAILALAHISRILYQAFGAGNSVGMAV